MKVVFTGAQGVGKTTLLDVMEKCFTLPLHFNYVRNFTRGLAEQGYEINKLGTDDTQLAIMNLHKHYIDCDQNIIVDRCALDGLVYTTYLHNKGQVNHATLEACRDIFKYCFGKYDVVFYLVPEFPITGDEYRSGDFLYQKEIADIFEKIVEEYQLQVIRLTGTVGDRLLKVQQVLRGKIIV